MKFSWTRMLITTSCCLTISSPGYASVSYSDEECHQLATAIISGQRAPLSNQELTELDGVTVQRLTEYLVKAHANISSDNHPDLKSNHVTSNLRSVNDDKDDSSQNYPNKLPPLTKSHRKFIERLVPDAQLIAKDHDLYPSVLLAQAILESNWGQSDLATGYNNLFGIKGSYLGKSIVLPTQESINGRNVQIAGQFRHYPSLKESLQDYANVLDQPMYMMAHKQKCSTYHQATQAIGKVYATDPHYHQKLDRLIDAYDLTKYDQIKTTKPERSPFPKDALARDHNAPVPMHHREKAERKGIVLPLIGGISSMSLVEIIKRWVK